MEEKSGKVMPVAFTLIESPGDARYSGETFCPEPTESVLGADGTFGESLALEASIFTDPRCSVRCVLELSGSAYDGDLRTVGCESIVVGYVLARWTPPNGWFDLSELEL